MSSGINRGGQGYVEKLFPAKFLDVEQIILNLIDKAGQSALMVNDVGDMTKTNAVFESLVLNLDAFVKALFTSDSTRDWSEYLDERKKIIGEWPDEPKRPNVALVRRLYSLTIYTVAKQRLFRMKRQVYFGVAWKLKQEANLQKLQEEEEKEGEEEEPDED
jgi:hypothetical protein